MVRKSKQENAGKKKKIKVLSLKKETVKDLTRDEASGVKGGTGVCPVVQVPSRSLVNSLVSSLPPSGRGNSYPYPSG